MVARDVHFRTKSVSHDFRCLWISLATGTLSYTVAFVVALLFDQPFGPVLVASLLVFAAMVLVVGRRSVSLPPAGR